MKPELWTAVENLYNDLVDLHPQERDARLDVITDADLRWEISSLIHAGPLSSGIAAWCNEERGRLLAAPVQSRTATLTLGSRSSAFQEGSILADRYRIVEFLGHGGMGVVYEAEDQDLGERIALKVIRPEMILDQRWTERLRREVRLARRVTHPNVCRSFDLEHHSQGDARAVFLTMELVRGETLAARLKRAGPLNMPEALPIAMQLCSALSAAHQANILHRDFKS